MSEKVLCQYCGAEMQKCVLYRRKFYECPECFADSPSEEPGCNGPVQDWETATKLALRRYQPENRVLTLHEALTMQDGIAIWREDRDGVERWVDMRVFKEQISPSFRSYGRVIRCWLRKPTEEERKAVPWGI